MGPKLLASFSDRPKCAGTYPPFHLSCSMRQQQVQKQGAYNWNTPLSEHETCNLDNQYNHCLYPLWGAVTIQYQSLHLRNSYHKSVSMFSPKHYAQSDSIVSWFHKPKNHNTNPLNPTPYTHNHTCLANDDDSHMFDLMPRPTQQTEGEGRHTNATICLCQLN